jgi:hypothetical protein
MEVSQDVQRPVEETAADVTLVTRGITITACVELSDPERLVVRPTAAAHARHLGVSRGDKVEVFWRAGYEERTLPAVIEQVEDGFETTTWSLGVTGPAERSQRRKAVRARIQLPVLLVCQATQLIGVTVDISEAGMRAEVDGWGLPPEPGSPVQASLTLEKGLLDMHGVVVRSSANGPRWQLSLSFDSLTEETQDRLRQRVFQALREERARLTD